MKKRIVSISLIWLMIGLCACGSVKKEQFPMDEKNKSENETETIVIKDTTIDNLRFLEGNSYNEEVRQEENVNLQSKSEEAYMKTLMDLQFNGISPVSANIEFDGSKWFMSDNKFAICDIDNDGENELIIQYITDEESKKKEYIYKFNYETQDIELAFCDYPSITYFDDGLLTVDTAYLERPDDDYRWMYKLYNATAGNFQTIATVNAWYRESTPVNCAGDEYPDEIDCENAGVVYLIFYDNEERKIFSQSQYDIWYNEVFGNAHAINVHYQNLSEENVWALDKSR